MFKFLAFCLAVLLYQTQASGQDLGANCTDNDNCTVENNECKDGFYEENSSCQPNADPTGAIVGGVIGGLLAVVLIALIVLFLLMKRRRNKMAATAHNYMSPMISDSVERGIEKLRFDPEMPLEDMPKTRPIKLADFPAHVADMHRNTDLLFSEEFKAVKMLCAKTPHAPISTTNTNTSKNRYTNILPYDHSRVKLLPTDGDEGSDYINANYMVGYNSPREFIATQGILPGTKDDFWRMIWEQNISLIVMLGGLFMRGRARCEQYWPKEVGEAEFFGDLQVTFRSQSVLYDYTTRVLDVTLGSTSRTLKHFNYTVWPCFGLPYTTESWFNFVRVTRDHVTPDVAGPICIHCGAGCGATGTFIAVDRLLQHLKTHDSIDIFGIVMEMREYRCNMVTTEDQYVFIHDCINNVLKAESAQDKRKGQNGQVVDRAV